MTRDELIEAAYNALIARYPVGETYWKVVEATIDAVEPLIRADERDRIRARTSDALSGLRAKVEALRWNDPRLVVHDQAIDDVLALFDGADL